MSIMIHISMSIMIAALVEDSCVIAEACHVGLLVMIIIIIIIMIIIILQQGRLANQLFHVDH